MLFKKGKKRNSVGDDKAKISPVEMPSNEPVSRALSGESSAKAGDLKQAQHEDPSQQEKSNQAFSDKQVTHGLGSSTEKEALVDEPDDESGTMSTLPPYSKGDTSLSARSDSKRKSTDPTSPSSSDVGPDFNPVTSNSMSADDGKEVYFPDARSPGSLTSSTAGNLRTSIPTSLQQPKSYREYPFYYTNTMTHLVICDPDHQVLYFAEVSPFAKSMPDVCLRDILAGGFDDLASKGSNLGNKEAQAASIVGVADSIPNSKHIKLGLGDPLQPETQKWTLMRNVHEDLKAGSEKYDLTVTHPSIADRTFIWIRGAGGDKDVPDMGGNSKDAKEQYRMLSDQGVVAVFRNAALASFKKRGSLRIYDVPGTEDMLLMIFTSISALCERQRRRKVKKGLLLGL